MRTVITTGQDFRTTITRVLIVGFAALVGVLVSAGVLMEMNLRQTRWIMHTYEVQRELSAIHLTTTELIGVRLSNRLHANRRRVLDAAVVQSELDSSVVRLSRLTQDNPRQQARMPLLIAGTSRIEREAGLDVPVEVHVGTLSDDPGLMIAALCTVMLDEETHLMEYRYARRAEINRAFFVVLGLTGVLLLAMAVLTYSSIRSHTREISASRAALHEANDGLEAAVVERTAELARVNAEIQRFVYIVSHDLRSPLVNIMGFTAEMETATRMLKAQLDLALAERPGSVPSIIEATIAQDMPESIQFIRGSAEKMDRLINSILQLSRLGRRTLVPEWLDLADLVRTIAASLQLQINTAQATVEIAQSLPEVLCDRIALEQILTNLIENAIKYRQAGRPLRIDVGAHRAGDRVVIAVADNGRGIDPRDLERVFDLFRRSGTQDQPGEGIGLAHVRALAHRLSGSIALESALGAGSTFTLTLPVHFTENRDLPAAAAQAGSSP